MIDIKLKENCVGCEACVQICPKHCITFNEDNQGFRYPKVDIDKCIECNLCEQVCPVINQNPEIKPTTVYSATNPNQQILRTSSSGGVFFSLAKRTIEAGGVVFGARFSSQWSVFHDFTETIDGLKAFQGSKYSQSRIGDTYLIARKFLNSGRKVMFTGTPCQIAGLRLFLRKDYPGQLLCVEVICHGVPSPKIWRDYLTYTLKHQKKAPDSISNINFRDKSSGWQDYSISIDFCDDKTNVSKSSRLTTHHEENPFFWGFNRGLLLRPSCFACPAKCGKSHADLTIGDFWNVNTLLNEASNPLGVSLVLCYNANSDYIFRDSDLNTVATSFSTAIQSNPSLIRNFPKPQHYDDFWSEYQMNGMNALIRYYSNRLSFIQKYIKRPVKTILGPNFILFYRHIKDKLLKH